MAYRTQRGRSAQATVAAAAVKRAQLVDGDAHPARDPGDLRRRRPSLDVGSSRGRVKRVRVEPTDVIDLCDSD